MSKTSSHRNSWKPAIMATAAAMFIRTVRLGWRMRLDDPEGMCTRDPADGPLIWLVWHHSLLAMPVSYRKWIAHRKMVALTSRSGDGEILARTVNNFGLEAVRGSSSRGGARALRKLVSVLNEGKDVIITPDGPRGPREVLQPGVVKLASLSGVTVVPLVVEPSRFFELKSWDAFRIPLPLCSLTVRLGESLSVPPDLDEADEEEWRNNIEMRLRNVQGRGNGEHHESYH